MNLNFLSNNCLANTNSPIPPERVTIKGTGYPDEDNFSIYVVRPITNQRILPDTPIASFPIDSKASQNSVSVQACRGEFEPASLVIRSDKDIKNITIFNTNLTDQNGITLPESTVDLRIIKCWYQAGTSVAKGPKVLVPELLLKDDALIKVDETLKVNYLRVNIENNKNYIDITSSDATFPDRAEIYDSNILMPFDIFAKKNKQVWITIHVPENAVPGDYHGEIQFKSSTHLINKINLNLTVLPFALKGPELDYGLYYLGILQEIPTRSLHYYYKTAFQYKSDLENMKNHGVNYPMIFQPYDLLLDKALGIRNSVGLPNDKLFSYGLNTENIVPITPIKLSRLQDDIKKWKEIASKYEFNQLFIYGKDEAKEELLEAQRQAWEIAKSEGVNIFVSCYEHSIDVVGDLLDLPILSGEFKPEEVAKWHDIGKQVFIYGYPQVGNEDPYIYRKNYGLMAIRNGYDGVMNFAYQFSFGHIWNDFDNPGIGRPDVYRDHVFAYPTSNGVIDTIQWEGFREAVDDVRYLTTLAYLKSINPRDLLDDLPNINSDLDVVRRFLITEIINETSQSIDHISNR